MRSFLDKTRFVTIPLLASFIWLSADMGLLLAAQTLSSPRGGAEPEPHQLVLRSRIFVNRAEEASRKLESRLPQAGKLEAASIFRRDLEQFRIQVRDNFEDEDFGFQGMSGLAQERFQRFVSVVEGTLDRLEASVSRVESGLSAVEGSREARELPRAVADFSSMVDEVALKDRRPLSGEELTHRSPTRLVPELPEPEDESVPEQRASGPGLFRKALDWMVALVSATLQARVRTGTQPAFATLEATPHRWSVPVASLTAAPMTPAVAAPEPPGPPDLAETPEVQLTEQIRELALRLGHSPLRIFEFVRNHIETEVYYGSLKGAQQTLSERSGNDIDQASLLIALLRASGAPARYVEGVAVIPREKLSSWMRIEDPGRAAEAFQRAGVPAAVATDSLGVSAVRVKTTWVRTWVDYASGLGTRRLGGSSASSWLDLAPGFKGHTFSAARDVSAEIGVDPASFLAEIKTSSRVDDAESYATDVPEPLILDRIEDWANQTRAYADANDRRPDTLFLDRAIIPQQLGALPGALPFETEPGELEFAKVPDSLAYKTTFDLLASNGRSHFSFETPLASLAGKRLVLSYGPSDAGDEATLAAHVNEELFPVYLMRVTPELLLDDTVVSSGEAVGMGSTEALQVSIRGPGISYGQTQAIQAGELSALVFDLQRTTTEMLHNRLSRLKTAERLGAGRQALLGEALTAIGTSYFQELDALNHLAAGSLECILTREPSWVTVSGDLEVQTLLGVPFVARADRLSLRLNADVLVPLSIDGDSTKERQFLVASSLTASALQHAALEQSLGSMATSAMRVIQKGNSESKPIHTLDAGNADPILAGLSFIPDGAKEAIRNAVAAGFQVTVPAEPVESGGLTRTGFGVLDPETGASSFNLYPEGPIGLALLAQPFRPASYLQDEPAGVYRSVTAPLLNWLSQAAEIATKVQLAYVPAVSAITFWFRDTTIPDKVTTIASAIAISSPIDRVSGRPNITGSLVSPGAFSPNGDGRKDVAQISASITRFADWKVSVKEGVTEIRQFTGQGVTLDATWDGLDEQGASVADGTYTVELTATDVSSGLSSVPVELTVRLDRTAPTTDIVNPADGATVGRLVSVIGTADDSALKTYTLEVGTGIAPTDFVRVETGAEATINNSLGVWNTESGDDGTYTLRLRAEDTAGNLSSFTRTANVLNPGRDVTAPAVVITTPGAGADLAGTFSIEIDASDNVGVARVELWVDSAVEKVFSASPYTHTVRSERLRNGEHLLQAKAFDAKGNEGVSPSVSITTTNAISEFSASPELFSPNGDGLDDSTVVSARLNTDQPWTLTVIDGASATRRTFTGDTGLISTVWDGRDDGAILVDDAAYIVRLETSTASADLGVRVENIDRPPTVSFSYPTQNAKLTGVVEIIGTATDTTFQNYTLEYKHMEAAEWQVLETSDQPVVNGLLGKLDTTLLQNDPYELRLTASDGVQLSGTRVTVYPTGDLKIGNFELSFTDLEIPVSGIPITVTRTYRSLDKNKGDFGIGWRLSYATEYTIDPDFNVTMNLPDGQRATFFIDIDPSDPHSLQRLREIPYTPEPGVQAKLHWDVVSFVLNQETFTLETKEGDRYNYSFGALRSIDTQNGNRLSFSATGITHQSGTGVTFVRDAEGRIETVIDPKGNQIQYGYDAEGDLVSVTDAESNKTEYTYLSNHNLDEIIDPLGRTPLRSDYDSEGRLVSTTDRRGNTIQVEHDLIARRALITDRNGAPSVYEYDSRGFVTANQDALGGRKTFEYDEKKNLVAEMDELGHRTDYGNDSRGNRTRETRYVEGRAVITEFTYDLDNNLTSITDPLGRKTIHSYDDKGNLDSATDPLGKVTRFEYDDEGNLTRQIYPDGSAVSSTYDATGNPLTETTLVGGVSETTTFTYDQAGNRETGEDPRGHISRFVYDKNNRVVEAHDPLGNFRETVYFGDGAIYSETDEEGYKTSYRYLDVKGQGAVVSIFRPDASTLIRQEDKAGNVIREEIRKVGTPSDDRVTLRTYDAKKQLTKVIYPDTTFTQNDYNDAGQLYAVTDERGNRTEFSYDEVGRQIAVRNPVGKATRFEYDDAGNRSAVIDPKGKHTEFRYDGANRLVRTIYPDGTVSSVTYDEMGRRATETDPDFRTTSFGYDEAGRLTSVKDALGNVTRYEYDPAGNRTAIVDANGHRTEFEYDERNLINKKIWPDGKYETYTYNPRGLLETKTDAKGQTITYSYDEVGRLKERRYPDATFVRFTYTKTGRREAVEDSRGVTRYGYNFRDRITEIEYPDGRKLTFTYDEVGNRKSLSAHVSGQVLTAIYTYDDANRLVAVTDPNGLVTGYGYDANGNRASLTYPNGTQTTYNYDDLNRLENLTTTGPAGTIRSYHYILGPAGNREKIEEADGTVREYQYDDLYRLTGEKVTETTGLLYEKAFVYDDVGNRLNQTTTRLNADVVGYTYDDRDRLLTENGVTYGWDDNGNLTSKSGEGEYFWDFENRLVRVEKADGTIITHAYDADGNRVRTEITPSSGPATVTDYLVDTSGTLSHVIAETDDSENLRAHYVRGVNDLVSLLGPTEQRFYHADGLGSIRLLTDDSGNVADTYSYTAFGEQLSHVGTNAQPYRFAGESYDRNTRFYYNRARWLDPSSSRFAGVDFLPGFEFEPISLHRYLYASANPVNRVDPSGNYSFSLAGVFTGLSVLSTLVSTAMFAFNPSFENALLLGLDIVTFPFGFLKVAKLVWAGRARNILAGIKSSIQATRVVSEVAAKSWLLGRGLRIFLNEKSLIQLGVGGRLVDFVAETPIRTLVLNEAKERLTSRVIRDSVVKFGDSITGLRNFWLRGGRVLPTVEELVITYKDIGSLGPFTVGSQGQLLRDGIPVIVEGLQVIAKAIPF